MSPFYAAYLRQLQPNQRYADGGTVTTQEKVTPNAQDTQLGGPSTVGIQSNTGHTGTTQDARSGGVFSSPAGREFDNGLKNASPLSGMLGSPSQILKNPIGQLTQGLGLSNNFQAQAAPVQAGTNAGQLQTAYNQAQSGINQQQGLVDQLNAQNGIQNQSNIYNQFGQVAQGQGPNPALEMLQNQTGNNIASQAALMASQRGASANPAALARTIAQQGAATQQNAIGQGAALQAQQSLNALGQQGNIAGQQVANQMAGVQGINNAVQNEQNILQGANTAYNNANVTQQGGLNSVNAGVAGQNQNAAGQVVGGVAKAVSSLFSDEHAKKDFSDATFDIDAFLDSLHKPNMAEGGEVDSPQLRETVSIAPAQSPTGQWLSSQVSSDGPASVPGAPNVPAMNIMSGSEGGAKGLGGMMAKGGEIEDAVEPKSYDYKNPNQPGAAQGRQYGITAQDLEKSPAGASVVKDTPQGKMVDTTHTVGLLLASVGRLNERIKELEGQNRAMAKGGKVDAMVSPGERYLDKEDVKEVKKGKSPMRAGKMIPGKAKVGGAKDDYANDTIPKKLQEGGIVIPRSVTQAPNAEERAHKFVEAIFMNKPKPKKR